MYILGYVCGHSDKLSQLEQLEMNWQDVKKDIEEQMGKIKMEIMKIEDNIYGESQKVCADRLLAQKNKQKLLEARLDHEKSAVKSKKQQVDVVALEPA